MKAIINEVAEKLKHEFITFFSEEEKGLVEAERYFSRRIADKARVTLQRDGKCV